MNININVFNCLWWEVGIVLSHWLTLGFIVCGIATVYHNCRIKYVYRPWGRGRISHIDKTVTCHKRKNIRGFGKRSLMLFDGQPVIFLLCF